MRAITSTVLPALFSPNEHHIIIGRGRDVKMHSGNRKFDQMIQAIAVEYAAASCKARKGMILSWLIEEIHDSAADAGFVKRDPISGRWFSVEESLARTAAAQALRNYLSCSYRSSGQFKQKRRLEQIQQGNKKLSPSTCSGPAFTICPPATQVATCVSPSHSSDEEDNETDSAASDFKTFALLESAFGGNYHIRNDDPFAPRPIADSSMPKKVAPLPIVTLAKPRLLEQLISSDPLPLVNRISLPMVSSGTSTFFRPIAEAAIVLTY
jgi:hypothetical protein